MPSNSSSQAAIVFDSLSKQYPHSPARALDALSLEVNKGEVFGFLGPNGAGKSTTIRLLLNFIQPTGGSAKILGKDIVRDSVAIRRYVGYLSGDFAAYPKMTGKQFFEYMGELQPPKRQSRATELARMFNADLSKPIGTLSKGNKQKIGIIQAFMHQPDVLILDEPTDGLDPLMQEVFYGLVQEVSSKGATVFVSSHNLSEVQKMCDRVGIIKNGVLVNENSIEDMELKASQTIDITFAKQPPVGQLKQIPGIHALERQGTNVTLEFSGDYSQLFALLAKHTVTRFETRELNLEQEFMRYYEVEAEQ